MPIQIPIRSGLPTRPPVAQVGEPWLLMAMAELRAQGLLKPQELDNATQQSQPR